MPLSKYYGGHGGSVMAKMKDQYGEAEGERIFYATANKKKQKAKGKKSHVLAGLKKALK